MKVSKRLKRGRQRWTADYEDGAGKRVQKLFATREAADEYVAQATLTARTKLTPDLSTAITYREFSERAFRVRTHLKPRTRAGYEHINARHVRLTVGAVNVRTGEMRYFDSRDETVHLDHVIASGALPPAFPAVRIDRDPYWDGGIYSNTPIEAVLDDKPREDSVIFAVQMWNPEGPEPETLWQVMGRQKDIQYASRNRSHIARQKQIHHLRHIIRELSKHVPEKSRESPDVKELASWGCKTTMHVVRTGPTIHQRRIPLSSAANSKNSNTK